MRPAAAPPDVADPELLERLPLAARHLLDVGCGTGALLAAYRRRNPRARLYGIEANAEAANKARLRLDLVAVADVEAQPMPLPVPEGGFDCIIYGNVLPALADPGRLLRIHAQALAPEGMMVGSAPNTAHWSALAGLMRGRFDPAELGAADPFYGRWGTLDSMRMILEGAGLVFCDAAPRMGESAAGHAFLAALEPALALLGLDRATFAQRALPIGYVWRAQRQPSSPITIAATMLPPVGGVSHARVIEPLQALATDPAVLPRLAPDGAVPVPNEGMANIVVLHRPVLSGAEGQATLKSLIGSGYVVVTEFDDHPDFFDALQGEGTLSFKGVHAVQTSTEPLAAILRRYNPEIAVFPNAVRELPEPHNFADPERLTLFFGALNRGPDWAPLIGALNAVAAKVGERLKFSVVHDRAFFDMLATPHKCFTPISDYQTYRELMGTAEIALMPLADTPFNRAKSDLKFIEAAAARLVALASPVVYAASIEDGRTGLLFSSPAELMERLMRLIAQPEIGRTLAEAARAKIVAQRMLAYQVAPRLSWYRDLWTRREPLHRALLQRVPALAG